MAAFVWRSLYVVPSIVTSRSSALIIPLVVVPPSSPRGLPIAIAGSPTTSVSESPITALVRPVASILISAMSVWVSEPITVASYDVPSVRETFTVVAPSITCAQVTIYPSSVRITPLPAPLLMYCPKIEFVDTCSVTISTTVSETACTTFATL